MKLIDDARAAGGLNLIVAHMDDEVLFAGGLILRLLEEKIPLRLLCVVHPCYCNAWPAKDPREFTRIRARTEAWRKVCEPDGIEDKVLTGDQWVYRVAESLADWILAGRHFPIVTHGRAGESGHRAHVALHHLVRSIATAEQLEEKVWVFSRASIRTIRYDREAKEALLAHYREGGHRTPVWDPRGNSIYKPWLEGQERFLELT